jgi:outer membrane receptor for Fe3+-dicitrate
MNDLSGELSLTKTIEGNRIEHNITVGAFLARTEADDQNVQTQYLSEFNDQPRLVDLSYTDPGGGQVILSRNGLYNPGAAYTNNFLTANRQAFYLTDEMKINRWRIDAGFRLETVEVEVNKEQSAEYQMDTDPSLSSDLQNVKWGNNAYLTGDGDDTDWAAVVAANYELNDAINLYGNASKGYFFPQPRSLTIANDGTVGSYKTEKIYQGELGIKYGQGRLKGTLAAYYAELNDRRDVRMIDDPDNPGTTIEWVTTQSTRTFGLEAAWWYELIKNLNFNGSFTYQDHEYDEYDANPEYKGNELARQPNILAFSALEYDNKTFDGGFSWNYTGKKYTDESNAVKLDALNIFRLDAGYTTSMGRKGETFRFGVSVYNLFDENGLTEGNPRDLSQQNEGVYFVGRPILPRRVFFRTTFNF